MAAHTADPTARTQEPAPPRPLPTGAQRDNLLWAAERLGKCIVATDAARCWAECDPDDRRAAFDLRHAEGKERNALAMLRRFLDAAYPAPPTR